MDNKIKKEAAYEQYRASGYISQEELLRLRDEVTENPDDYYFEIELPIFSSMVDELLIRRAEDLKPSKVEEALQAEVKHLKKIEEKTLDFVDTINKLNAYFLI